MLEADRQLEEVEKDFFAHSTALDDKHRILTLSSHEAIAWAMRYFSTLDDYTQRDSTPQKQQEAKQLIDECQHGNNKEIEKALLYLKQRLATLGAENIFHEKQNAIQEENITLNKKLEDQTNLEKCSFD